MIESVRVSLADPPLRGDANRRVAEFAPTLVHALGDRSGGRVQLRTCTLEPYAYVSCEYPQELLDAIRCSLGPGSWLECDDDGVVRVG